MSNLNLPQHNLRLYDEHAADPSMDPWGTPPVTGLPLDFVMLFTTLRACQFSSASFWSTSSSTYHQFVYNLYSTWQNLGNLKYLKTLLNQSL